MSDIKARLQRLIDMDEDDRISRDDIVDTAEDALAVIEDMEADQRRLEWLVSKECFVSHLKGGFYVADVGGFMECPERRNWREAIDEAMGHVAE